MLMHTTILRPVIISTLLLSNTLSNAGLNHSVSMRISGVISHLTAQNSGAYNLPYLNTTDDYHFACPSDDDDKIDVNTAFVSNDQKSIAKDSVDTTAVNRLSVGFKLQSLPETAYPSDAPTFGISSEVYGIYEGEARSVLASLFTFKPRSTFGADIGVVLDRNGNQIEIGGGAFAQRIKIETGPVFDALSSMDNDAIDGNTNASLFNDGERKPYEAEIDYLVAPYIYAELSTHLGDVATVFIKGQYGFATDPKLNSNPSDTDTQMFSGDHTQFEEQYEFRTNTIKVGLEINLF